MNVYEVSTVDKSLWFSIKADYIKFNDGITLCFKNETLIAVLPKYCCIRLIDTK
jgi:hypothetical protein